MEEEKAESLYDRNVKMICKSMAEEYVEKICQMACKLAKHRNSDKLEEKDIYLATALMKVNSNHQS